MKLIYAAYGSNLNEKHMKKTCPTASFLGIGILEGYKLSHMGPGKRCFLNLEKDPNSQIEIGLYEINVSEVMSLDNYEEFPELYDKVELEINFGSDREFKAFTYIMPPGDLNYCKPKKKYFKKCLKGYQEKGLDEEQLKKSIRK